MYLKHLCEKLPLMIFYMVLFKDIRIEFYNFLLKIKLD